MAELSCPHGRVTKLAYMANSRKGYLYGLLTSLGTTVVVDLLGELDIPGLESLQLFLTKNTDREYVHFSESDSVTVKDFYVRRLMHRVNSLPKGHEYNPWSESLRIAHDVSHAPDFCTYHGI